MRSVLQFLGFASGTICAVLLAGALLSSSAIADATLPAGSLAVNCGDCCGCDYQVRNCMNIGTGRDCEGFECPNKCICNYINPAPICGS